MLGIKGSKNLRAVDGTSEIQFAIWVVDGSLAVECLIGECSVNAYISVGISMIVELADVTAGCNVKGRQTERIRYHAVSRNVGYNLAEVFIVEDMT